MGRIIPYIMENKKCSKTPTRCVFSSSTLIVQLESIGHVESWRNVVLKKSPLVNVNSLRTGKSSSIIYKFGKSTNFLWAMASMSQSVSLYQRVNPIRSLLNHHKITIYSGKITIFLWFSYSGVPPLFSFSPPPWPVENGHAKPGPWKEGEKCQDPTRGSHQQLKVPSNMEGTKHFTYDNMVHCHLYMIQWFAYIKTNRGVYIYIL